MTTTRALAAAIAALATVVAAGCGSGGGGAADVASLGTASEASSSDPSGSTDPRPPVDPDEAMLAYTECMREHGVDLPDPRPTGDGRDAVVAVEVDPSSDEFREAQEACEPIMEEAMGDLEIDPEREAEMREELLAFTECMREQGVDMPDPVFGEGGRVEVEMQAASPVEPGDEPAAAPDSDEFRAAEEACAGERPGGIFVTSDTVEGS